MNEQQAAREVKRIGDWLAAQTRLEPPPPRGPGRPRKHKPPTREQIEQAKKQAMVAAMIATRRGRA